MTLTELQNKLSDQQFLRIHKSYILAIDKMEKLEKQYVRVAGEKLPLAKAAKDLLISRLEKTRLQVYIYFVYNAELFRSMQ